MALRFMKQGKFLVYCKSDFNRTLNDISELDKFILGSWKKAEDDEVMQYRISNVKINTKLICFDNLSFQLSLNEKRFSERRKPDQFSTLNDPFNMDKFNFTKINQSEVLLQLTDDLNSSERNLVLVNLSPFKFGHSLFVPDVNRGYNQFLRRKPLEIALHAFMLCCQRNAVMGFNSLLAHASINHLHFHLWNNENPLLSSKLSLLPIIYDKNDNKTPLVYQMIDHPVENLVVVLENPDQIDVILSRFFSMIQCLQIHDCPHCVLFTRCFSNNSTNHSDSFNIRLIVWLRNKSTDEKLQYFQRLTNSEAPNSRSDGNCQFAVAVSELAGLINIGDSRLYDRLTEEELKHNFDRIRIRPNLWNNIINDIKSKV